VAAADRSDDDWTDAYGDAPSEPWRPFALDGVLERQFGTEISTEMGRYRAHRAIGFHFIDARR